MARYIQGKREYKENHATVPFTSFFSFAATRWDPFGNGERVFLTSQSPRSRLLLDLVGIYKTISGDCLSNRSTIFQLSGPGEVDSIREIGAASWEKLCVRGNTDPGCYERRWLDQFPLVTEGQLSFFDSVLGDTIIFTMASDNCATLAIATGAVIWVMYSHCDVLGSA